MTILNHFLFSHLKLGSIIDKELNSQGSAHRGVQACWYRGYPGTWSLMFFCSPTSSFRFVGRPTLCMTDLCRTTNSESLFYPVLLMKSRWTGPMSVLRGVLLYDRSVSSICFQVSSYEPCSAAGPGVAAGLCAERGAVRGAGSAPGDHGVGWPRRGFMQVGFAESQRSCWLLEMDSFWLMFTN